MTDIFFGGPLEFNTTPKVVFTNSGAVGVIYLSVMTGKFAFLPWNKLNDLSGSQQADIHLAANLEVIRLNVTRRLTT